MAITGFSSPLTAYTSDCPSREQIEIVLWLAQGTSFYIGPFARLDNNSYVPPTSRCLVKQVN